MTEPYIVYGAAGSGSVPVEAALTLLGLPYRVIDSTILAERADPALAKVNPMLQVPALVLPGGELMTESAAILTWLADAHPEARLAPTMAGAARPAFLRWISFVSAAIYGLYWIRDDPSRVTDGGEAAKALLRARTADRMLECWGIMDAQLDPGRYLLGDDLGVLDLYVTVVSRWGPRRARFYEAAPKMSAVVRRVDADPRLASFWAERFAFAEGGVGLGLAYGWVGLGPLRPLRHSPLRAERHLPRFAALHG
jgi:GST-like protein